MLRWPKPLLFLLLVGWVAGCEKPAIEAMTPSPGAAGHTATRPTTAPAKAEVTPPSTKLTDFEIGQREARADIAAGRLQLRTAGLPRMDGFYIEQYIKKQIGVSIQPIAGCVVTTEEIDALRGYNEVMHEEIDRRFGPGTLRRLHEDAEQAYEESLKAKPATRKSPVVKKNTAQVSKRATQNQTQSQKKKSPRKKPARA